MLPHDFVNPTLSENLFHQAEVKTQALPQEEEREIGKQHPPSPI